MLIFQGVFVRSTCQLEVLRQPYELHWKVDLLNTRMATETSLQRDSFSQKFGILNFGFTTKCQVKILLFLLFGFLFTHFSTIWVKNLKTTKDGCFFDDHFLEEELSGRKIIQPSGSFWKKSRKSHRKHEAVNPENSPWSLTVPWKVYPQGNSCLKEKTSFFSTFCC